MVYRWGLALGESITKSVQLIQLKKYRRFQKCLHYTRMVFCNVECWRMHDILFMNPANFSDTYGFSNKLPDIDQPVASLT